MSEKITVARGDGIGPEIMEAVLSILKHAGADIQPEFIDIGEQAYKDGYTSGIRPEDWETIGRNRAFLKAPITTPQGGGYKSLNVTIRKTLGLFANVRPIRALHPFIKTRHPEMNMVIVRENEEDLYAGIEHRQTDEVYQCLKLISRPGSERIIRYAFEYARHGERNKVTCMTKDNIMKLTDGLFHDIFDEVSPEYPEIKTEHQIIDIGTARLADTPEDFDVIVVPNLYGDIISDVAAQITGSVGLAGSANIGVRHGMFEAIHGSAPPIAGQDIANPSGLLMGALMMLDYIGQGKTALKIENAWLRCIEDGIATNDFYSDLSDRQVGTHQFAQELISRLGERPEHLKPISGGASQAEFKFEPAPRKQEKKALDGVDIFVHENDRNPSQLGHKIQRVLNSNDIRLEMITNRGVKVFPEGNPETFCTDHWRCRFTTNDKENLNQQRLFGLMQSLADADIDIIKSEMLFSFDGKPGYSLGQGQ